MSKKSLLVYKGFDCFQSFESLSSLRAFLERDVVKQLIGKNYIHYHEFYLERYDRVVNAEPKQKVKGSINWLGFLLPPAWLLYRKMYAVFFVAMFLFTLQILVESYFGFNGGSSSGTVFGVIVLLMGKDMYLSQLVGWVKKYDQLETEEQRERFVKWRRGGSLLMAIVAMPLLLLSFVALDILLSNVVSGL